MILNKILASGFIRTRRVGFSQSLRVWLVLLDGGPSKFIRVISGGSWRTASLLSCSLLLLLLSSPLRSVTFKELSLVYVRARRDTKVSRRSKSFVFSFPPSSFSLFKEFAKGFVNLLSYHYFYSLVIKYPNTLKFNKLPISLSIRYQISRLYLFFKISISFQ